MYWTLPSLLMGGGGLDPPSLILTGSQCPQDNSPRCHASAAAAQERDGVCAAGKGAQPLLHLHTEHYPGRGGPHTGRGGAAALCTVKC